MANLEELKKSFIVDEESFEEQELAQLIEAINKICVLDKTGNVRFRKEKLIDKEKIRYILIARFLANKLDSTISKTVKNADIESVLKKTKPQIRARLSELREEGIIKDISRDEHEIKPIMVHKILMERKNG